LIGDAGYGVIFLSALLISRKVFKVRLAPLVTRLIVVFNLAAVAWGVLTANYFGMTLPDGSFLAKIALIDGDNIELMMKICFTIGLVHLTLAHLWTFISVINSLKAVAEVGWLMTLWAAYFLAMFVIAGVEFPMVMAYVGGLGIVLALIFSGSLLSVAGIFQFPFAVINCFSDIASYLRLFAVGAAALALAQVFNGMAGDLIAGGGALGILGGLLILLLGHSLNLVLGLLSVLVHGLRLNLLEFSGHIGLEWAGFKYNPFKMNRFSNDQLQ
jgi:V/A-type H+-transporting ATPase subunit I